MIGQLSGFNCAIAQLNSSLLDKETNLQRALKAVEEAARHSARLIAFPELFLTGYHVRNHLGELSEPIQGESVQQLSNAARKHRMVIIAGFAEASDEGVYDSAAVIDANGDILGSYRKVHLYDEEKEYFLPGDSYPVFETAVGPLGVQVCFDVEFPEAPRALALSGASIIVCVAANMIPFQHHQEVYLRARALENHVWHVFANRVGVEETTIFFGQSGIADPLGEVMVQGGDREALLYGSIDYSRINESLLTLTYLANRRPDTYGNLTNPEREIPTARRKPTKRGPREKRIV